MTDQFRVMCADLVEAIEDDDFFRPTDPNNDALRFCKAVLSARTALAQPVAEGPTIAELWELYEEMADEPGDWAWVRDYALAVLAKWGAPTAQPVAEGPTVMEIIELHTWLEDEWRANNDGEDLPILDFARGVLAKWGHPTPQPVAVSERWPEFSDCDPQERVWAWNPVLDHWKLSRSNR